MVVGGSGSESRRRDRGGADTKDTDEGHEGHPQGATLHVHPAPVPTDIPSFVGTGAVRRLIRG